MDAKLNHFTTSRRERWRDFSDRDFDRSRHIRPRTYAGRHGMPGRGRGFRGRRFIHADVGRAV
jgi:hypothetical protein